MQLAAGLNFAFPVIYGGRRQAMYPAETNIIGPTPTNLANAGTANLTFIIGGRPIKRSGTFTKLRIYAGASATVKIKHFRRSGFTFTMLSEQTVNVVSGLNTFNSANSTLTPVSVTAGDYFGLFSTTGNYFRFDTTYTPGTGTEYYALSGDVTTSATVGASTVPTVAAIFATEFTVTVPATPALPLTGSMMYLGVQTPIAGNGNASTSNSYVEDTEIIGPAKLQTIQAYASAGGLCMFIVYGPSATGQGFLPYRVFTVDLLSGSNTFTAGIDFPIDVQIPTGGMLGWWPLATTLTTDTVNGQTFRLYRGLTGAAAGGVFPTTETDIFNAAESSVPHQIRFGYQRTAADVHPSPIIDWTFSNAFTADFDGGPTIGTVISGWSITGGVAQNSATGLTKPIKYHRGGYHDGIWTVYATFTTSSDEIALFRQPSIATGDSLGSVWTVNVGTGLIALRNALGYNVSTMPAVNTSKTTSLSLVTGRLYKFDLTKSGTSQTLTITDTTNNNTDSLTFNAKAIRPAGAHNLTAGMAIGEPGVCANAGTINVSRAIWSTLQQPTIMFFGDSITEGTGASVDANCWSYKLRDLVTGGGLISPHSGTTSTSILSYLNMALKQYNPVKVFVLAGSNDSNVTTWQNNITEIVGRLNDAGVDWRLGALPPRNDAHAGPTNSANLASSNAWLRSTWPGKIVGFDYALTTGNTGLPADQNASLYITDTVHPNDNGNTAMYNQALADAPGFFV